MAQDADSFACSVFTSAVFMLTLMPICVALRLWSQWLLRASFDACCLCILFAFATAATVIGIWLVSIGLGIRNVDDESVTSSVPSYLVHLVEDPKYLKLAYTDYLLSYITLAASKVAVLFYYRRVFPTTWIRRATLAIGLLVVTWAVVVMFVSAFACHPADAFWNAVQFHRAGISFQCIEIGKFYTYSTIPGIVADLLILALPIKEVVRLQMDRKRKLAVCAMFLTGGIVTVLAIVRLAIGLANSIGDGAAIPWTVAEQGLSVVCACLPGIAPGAHRIKHILNPAKIATISRARTLSVGESISSTSLRPDGLSKQDSSTNPFGSFSEPKDASRRNSAPPNLLSKPLTAFKNAIGWSPLPTVHAVSLPSHHRHNHSAPSETSHSVFERDFHALAGQNRNEAEMEEYRRLYQYSAQNPFSQSAYANLTDTQLYGGILVERTVDLTVEEAPHVDGARSSGDTKPIELRVFDGRGPVAGSVWQGDGQATGQAVEEKDIV